MPRRPTSNADKRKRGNPGRRPDAHEHKALTPCVPDPPEWLSDEAREEFLALTGALGESDILTEADQAALAIYAMRMAKARELHQQHRAVTVEGVGGSQKKDPAETVIRQACMDVLAVLGQLGGTPVARQKLRMFVIESDEADSPFKLLNGGENVERFQGNKK